ncbi:MAG: nucleoside phosphorylase [Anaerolineaceae bacterium]
MNDDAPILEFDTDRSAILTPQVFNTDNGGGLPNIAVLCFFHDVLAELVKSGELTVVHKLGSEMGEHPVYVYQNGGRPVTVFHPGVGAPLAAGFLEELIALGVTRFVVCGGCGVLDRKIAVGHPVILTGAVRDEGTSYHYLPPSREVDPHVRVTQALITVFKESGLEYILGKSWTTDALYRETKGKRAARIAEGCSVVEMEAAALFAVAKFREVMIGQVVYGGDLVVPEGWDRRDWHNRSDDRRLLFDLAIQAVRLLA